MQRRGIKAGKNDFAPAGEMGHAAVKHLSIAAGINDASIVFARVLRLG